MAVEYPDGTYECAELFRVCGVVLEGEANTGIVQATGKSSRVRLFKGLILFSQGFAGVGKITYPLSVGMHVCKRLVL